MSSVLECGFNIQSRLNVINKRCLDVAVKLELDTFSCSGFQGDPSSPFFFVDLPNEEFFTKPATRIVC